MKTRDAIRLILNRTSEYVNRSNNLIEEITRKDQSEQGIDAMILSFCESIEYMKDDIIRIVKRQWNNEFIVIMEDKMIQILYIIGSLFFLAGSILSYTQR